MYFLEEMGEIELLRKMLVQDFLDSLKLVELHSSGDASFENWGTSNYVRPFSLLGKISVSLVVAKSTINHKISISFPRQSLKNSPGTA